MEANDAFLDSGDATTRARELRANLGARQDAETLLAEAGRIRQDSAVAADALVAEAQELSEQLVDESRRSADQLTVDARERADGILARARIEAEEVSERARASADALRAKAENDIEEHRRRVRAEVTSQVTRDLTEQHRLEQASVREQSEALISDLEASVRILGVSLESSLSNVSELIGSLEALRSTTDRAPSATTPSGPAPSGPGDADPVPSVEVPDTEVPDSEVFDAEVFDAEVPDSEVPDSEVPDSEVPPVPATEAPTAQVVEAPPVQLPTIRAAAPLLDDVYPSERPRPLPRSGGQHIDETSYGGGRTTPPASSVPSSTSQFGTDGEPGNDQVSPNGEVDHEHPRSATEAFLSSSSLEMEQSTRELRELQQSEEARRRRGDESKRAAQEREVGEGAGEQDEAEPDTNRPLGWLFRSAH